MENSTSTVLEWIRSSKRRKLAESVLEIMENLRDYYPMTVRQVYYQCVSAMLVRNDQNEYRKISALLTDLRQNDVLSWGAIEDRSRRTIGKEGVSDMKTWAMNEIEQFLDNRFYWRCAVQTQPVYVEVCTEKDALASIFEKAIRPYCTRLNVVRGQCSSTLVSQMSNRFGNAVMKGLTPIMIHLGDFDPSGIAIPKSIVNRMSVHHSVEVKLIRAGLNQSQIREYNLPFDPETTGKKQDPNFKSWAAEYGEKTPAVELDALHPGILADIVKKALESVYDMDLFAEQKRIEAAEDARIKDVRAGIFGFAMRTYPEIFQSRQV